MKRRTTGLLAAALLAVLLLAGCGTRPLPSGMEEEAVGQAGQEIVEMLVARDYQGVVDAFRPDIAEELGVTADTIQSEMDKVSEAGPYVETIKRMAVGGKNKDYGEDYAVAVIYCEHEEKNIAYQRSFDTDLNLIGIYAEVKKK